MFIQVMVQGVADTYDTYRTRAWEDKPRVNTLVVIGRLYLVIGLVIIGRFFREDWITKFG